MSFAASPRAAQSETPAGGRGLGLSLLVVATAQLTLAALIVLAAVTTRRTQTTAAH